MESPAMNNNEEVDSALCAGMRDPRERAALFRLEHWYQEFCQSASMWMEVGGAYNRSVFLGPRPGEDPLIVGYQQQVGGGHQTSFHRLLVHRLADRFGIRRESRGSNIIRLWKCPETRIPAVLLQELDPSIYCSHTNNNNTNTHAMVMADGNYMPINNMNNTYNNPSLTSNGSTGAPTEPKAETSSAITATGTTTTAAATTTTTTTGTEKQPPVEKQPKKLKIMKKRSPGGQNIVLQRKPSQQGAQLQGGGDCSSDRQSEFGNSRSSSSEQLEAKERAYKEARARIFNENEDAAASTPAVATATDDGGAATNTAPPISTPLSVVLEDEATAASMANMSIHQTDGDGHNTSRSSPKNSDSSFPTNNNNTNGSMSNEVNADRKAVYRNRAEEAADPDFQRGRDRKSVV